ncbi:MAG: hypothetical protein ACXVFN_03640 [Solirubrobacteraceae bacterium]
MHPTTADMIEDWEALVPCRRSRLRAAGFDRELSLWLAADRRYDVHALLALAARGCPPALAARIVAPLDVEPPA